MVNYNKPSIQLALDMVNKAVNAQFTERDVEFTRVTYLPEGVFNTEATLVPAVGSKYQDKSTIKYNRVNVQQLFKGIDVRVLPAHQRLVSDYLPMINNAYGLKLYSHDIIDGVIPPKAKPPIRVRVTIHPDNPAFYGEFILLITDESKSLKRIVNDIKIDEGISYPINTKKIQGPYYFYDVDFSLASDLLNTLQVGWVVPNSLLDIVNQVSKDTWIIADEFSDNFNLSHATVVYNGVIDDARVYTNRTDYTHVTIIQLNDDYCTNVGGYLTLHYNVGDINSLIGI